MSDSVHIRNARALDERNKQDRVRLDALTERVRHLENQIAMLGQGMRDSHQMATAALAARGTGPTSR